MVRQGDGPYGGDRRENMAEQTGCNGKSDWDLPVGRSAVQKNRLDSPVLAVSCPDYGQQQAREAIRRTLEAWPAFESFRQGTKIAVKVNLVSAMAPDAAGTTHPQLVCELCRALVGRGAQVTVGDSPGGLFTKEALRRVYRVCGLDQVEETGARLNWEVGTEDVSFPEAKAAHVFSCTSWIRQADLIIDFAKLKTHGMVGMTASVKNLFGAIPGTTKPEYHMRFPETQAFCNMLIDLNECLKPALNLVDAVVCMEGNGPTGGSPRKLGLLLSSVSPYNLDMVCADLIGLRRADVPTLQAAYERGLGPEDVTDVRVIGEKTTAWRIPDFRGAASIRITFTGSGPLGRLTEGIFKRAMQQVPKVKSSECIGCGKCAKICPAHAIAMAGKKPHIDRNRCIHCFCCQEFCPRGAMKVHRTLLARVLQKGG